MRFEIQVSGTFRQANDADSYVDVLVVAVDATDETLKVVEEWRTVPYGKHVQSFAYGQAQAACDHYNRTKHRGDLRGMDRLVHPRGHIYQAR